MEVYFLPALAVAIFIVVAVVGHIMAKRRREALAAFAQSKGLVFCSQPGAVHETYDALDFRPFGNGHGRRSQNLISGNADGVDWEIFDYRYKTGSGKHQQVHRHHVVAARVGLHLPRLSMRPEGFFDRVAAAVGFDDIDFESDAFSRRYHVKCSDRRLAYDLIHPQMIEYLMTIDAHDWQMAGRLILIVGDRYCAPERLSGLMSAVVGFTERLPAYVREDLSRA